MDNESMGQHIIFVTILIFILCLSYYSIPFPEPVNRVHKISKKAQTKVLIVNTDPIKTSDKITIVVKPAETKPVPVSAPPEAAVTLSVKSNVKTNIKKQKHDTPIDIISMNNPLYKTHKKSIVQFTHKKHVEDYLIACGDCHHDETGKPLDLKFNDEPGGCIDCHRETQKPPGEKLGKKEKIAKYHFEALHANCIGCHRDYNKKKGDAAGKGPAPTSCTKCHPKKNK